MPVASARRLSRTSASGVVLLLSLALAATGSSSAALSAGLPTAATTAGETLTPKALVRHIALVDSDFTDGTTVLLYTRGNRVGRQVTLDLCGFNFAATESRRTARHQTAILPATPRKSYVSNEVVAYETAHFAAKALRQVRKAVAQCPDDVFVASPVNGVADQRYNVSRVRTSSKLSVTDNAVVTLKITSKDHPNKPYWALLMYQRHGTVLDAMYRLQWKKPTAAKVASLRKLARITGSRLAAS